MCSFEFDWILNGFSVQWYSKKMYSSLWNSCRLKKINWMFFDKTFFKEHNKSNTNWKPEITLLRFFKFQCDVSFQPNKVDLWFIKICVFLGLGIGVRVRAKQVNSPMYVHDTKTLVNYILISFPVSPSDIMVVIVVSLKCRGFLLV